MPSDLLAAAKAVLALLDRGHVRDPSVDALRAAVEEAERASPEAAIERGEYIAGISGPSHARGCDFAHRELEPCRVPHRAVCICVGHQHVDFDGRCGWNGDLRGERCPCRVRPKGDE